MVKEAAFMYEISVSNNLLVEGLHFFYGGKMKVHENWLK